MLSWGGLVSSPRDGIADVVFHPQVLKLFKVITVLIILLQEWDGGRV
jgi:hypothetical protein